MHSHTHNAVGFQTITKVLDTQAEIRDLCHELKNQTMLAVDTEFIRETTFFPMMALIQVATKEKSWLIDPLNLTNDELQPLFVILQDPKILKIFHASQADQECFYTNYGFVVKPTLDTAAAASLCGYGESVGLAKLLKELLSVNLRKGHARTDWTKRPIPQELLSYAHNDVQYLIVMAEKLFSMLDKKNRRSWALELSSKFENPKNYELNVEGIANKIAKNGKLDRRGFATLKELLFWREKRVREVNVPRRRIADDDVLIDLAMARPKSMSHLSAFRGLNKGEFKNSGEHILSAIARAASIAENDLIDIPRSEIPTPEEARIIELVQCFVKIKADELQLVAKHLISNEELLLLYRARITDIAAVIEQGLMNASSAKLIGDDLLKFLDGKKALVLEPKKGVNGLQMSIQIKNV